MSSRLHLGLLEPAREMEFTARFTGEGGTSASDAAAAAVTNVPEQHT
ncbi:hypothetical protein [Streptomyces justiciae]|nr:hypothetical protein [Streptomyces justiciae]MCW8380439.1 hypothetical protein [Streptomyces justiciae]